MNWIDLVTDFERNNSAVQIAVQAISEPLASKGLPNPTPDLNVRLFHDLASHVVYYRSKDSDELHSVHPGFLVSPNSSFRKLTAMLESKPFVLILEEDRTEKIVCWQDLNRPPYSSWIFGQVSLLETMLRAQFQFALDTLELTRGLTCEDLLTESQIKSVREVQARLGDFGSDASTLDAMTFSQLRTAVLKLNKYGMPLVPWSRERFKGALHRANALRNASAHVRPILKKRAELSEIAKALDEIEYMNIQLAKQMDELESLTSTRYVSHDHHEHTVGDILPEEYDSMCFITGWNPSGEVLGEEENQMRNAALHKRLQGTQLRFTEGVAVDPSGRWDSEVSFCVHDADYATMNSIAMEFNQSTIFWAQKGVPFRICRVAK